MYWQENIVTVVIILCLKMKHQLSMQFLYSMILFIGYRYYKDLYYFVRIKSSTQCCYNHHQIFSSIGYDRLRTVMRNTIQFQSHYMLTKTRLKVVSMLSTNVTTLTHSCLKQYVLMIILLLKVRLDISQYIPPHIYFEDNIIKVRIKRRF